MAFEIIETCVNCYACEPLCPNQAIYQAKPHFLIDSEKCTECIGDYMDAQCAAICPIEGAILSDLGEPLNPVGSLTGIPPELVAQYQAAVDATYAAALATKTT